MAYDEHTAKRARTDGDRGFGQQNFKQDFRGGRPQEEENPNHVLLLTVKKPAYPITLDMLYTICSSSGKVHRIVIFKKNGFQAMVEFDGLESAKRAKQSLCGADIYSGCNLKVEYARPTKLNVRKNDTESWDYTNHGLGDGNCGGFGGGMGPQDRGPNDGYGGNGFQDQYGPPQDRFGGGSSYDRGDYGPMSGGGGNGSQHGCVVMIYGLGGKKMTCDKIFNLFCLYGNISRIMFLKSKEGCAMIQMGDPLSVERSMVNLNGAIFFDCKLSLRHSKQAFLEDVQQPFELPDGSLSFKDYTGCRNNRYKNMEAASKNRIQPPSRVLHFFNAPPGITKEELLKVFENAEVPCPSSVRLFAARTPTSSTSGLLEFNNVADALEGLIACNNASVRTPTDKFPYTFKLCFSTAFTTSGPRF